MSAPDEIWRWNSDHVWHYFSSMVYEARHAQEAESTFMMYHHVRGCIFFSVAVVEAFFNREIRLCLERQGISESKITEELERPIGRKLQRWSETVASGTINIDGNIERVFNVHRTIRNEITHPSRRDHSIYVDLENLSTSDVVETTALIIVTIYETRNEPFPYWVFGWNYVGHNGDPASPTQSNNMNGFFWSLKNMGFETRSSENQWDKLNMVTLDDYYVIKRFLDAYPFDIEPLWQPFTMRPRLTCRWWDRDFLTQEWELSTGKQV